MVASRPGVATPPTLVRTLAVGTAYAIAGFSLGGLAMPPGYATPVWPAAGVALVAVMGWGWTAVPGVLLGSFLVNLHISISDEVAPALAALTAGLIALGAAAQAVAGARLARYAIGPGNPLETGASVPAFLLVGGPVGCLVNAVWAPTVLLGLGRIPADEVVFDAATWWAGDTIGVFLCAPLLLASLASPTVWTFQRWVGLAVPLAASLLGVVALFTQTQRAIRADAVQELEARARLVAAGFEASVSRAEAYTESVARAFGALPAIDRGAFRALVTPWIEANAAVEAFEWAPLVAGEDLAAFEVASRDAEFPDYHVRDLAPDGRLVPAARRAYHAPILFVEPVAREGGSAGFDFASSPARREALEAARDTGDVVGTSRVRLVLWPGEWGALLIAASYGGMEAPRVPAERRADVRGYVATVIRVDELARIALERAGDAPLGIRVTDVSETPAQTLSGAEPAPTDLSWSTLQAFGGRTWRVEVTAPEPGERSWIGWTVLAGGLGVTGLLAAFVLDAAARSLQVDRLVRDRTAELARANEALTRSNVELQRFAYVASHDMREPLRTIACYTELLESDATDRLDEVQRDWLGRVLGATRRMQEMVAELLAFARAESRVEVLEAVPLAEPARAALDGLDAAVREAGAEVVVDDLPVARCDRVEMVQLFENLLSNGLKFHRPGVPPVVEVSGERKGDLVEIAVRDNGLGIERRHWARIFEMFQRLHPPARYPGHGIGLATCRRIVERHGGHLWVTSQPGVGSVFRFTLPAAD